MINFASQVFHRTLCRVSSRRLVRAADAGTECIGERNSLKFTSVSCSRLVLGQKYFSSSSSMNSEDDNPSSGATSKSNPPPAPDTHTKESSKEKGGFIRAMAKMEGHESFAKMLRNSPLVQMGDPQGKIVEGTIVHVVDDDLYIDFGAKFNCVCPRPQKNGSSYALGKKVRIVVHDLELSTRFLGAKTDLTILEADCTLIGLLGKQESQRSVASGNEDEMHRR